MNRPLVFWNAVSYHVVTWDIQPVSVGDLPTWCQFGLTQLTARRQRCVTSVHGPSVALSHVGTPWKWKQKIKILVVFTDFQNSNHFFCFLYICNFRAPSTSVKGTGTFFWSLFSNSTFTAKLQTFGHRHLGRNYRHTFSWHHKPHCCSTYACSRSGSDYCSICSSATNSNNACSQWNTENKTGFDVTQQLWTWERCRRRGQAQRHNSFEALLLFGVN